jgi:hypothetical protein
MTTVLFIHGTGVREPEYTKTFGRIKARVEKLRPGLSAEPCFWGEKGAVLQADGDSLHFDRRRNRFKPGGSAARQAELDEDEELALWGQLLADPLFEVRIRRIVKPPRGNPGPFLGDRVRSLGDDPALARELADAGLAGEFAGAVRDVTGSPEFIRAFGRSTTTDGNTEAMLARALVASCLATAADGGLDVSGDHRDQLVDAVVAAFGPAPDQGLAEITDGLKRWALETASWPAGPWARKWRPGAIEQVADIVLYQAHGGPIREFVRDRVREIPGPVVLLAHSLGGIIAFDLLAGPDTDGLDQVRLLVTVGSQVPLLYEIGALTCDVNYPHLLPDSFTPKWINVYDRRDLLAYVGDHLFHQRCQDRRVNTRTPFPAAHGAYWDSKEFYKLLGEEVEGL